jgi:hypothetical protein
MVWKLRGSKTNTTKLTKTVTHMHVGLPVFGKTLHTLDPIYIYIYIYILYVTVKVTNPLFYRIRRYFVH